MVLALSASAAPPLTLPTARERYQAQQDARLQSHKDAVETLKSSASRETMAQQRKAFARARVDRIKQQIAMLRMTAGNDPKTTARIAAALARELASAVRAYAAAGGSTADISAPAAPTGGSAPTATAGASAPATDAVVAEGAADSADTGSPPAGLDTGSSDGSERGSDEASKDGKSETDATDPYRQAMAATQQRGAADAARAAEAQADKEFMAEVKRLADELKRLLKATAQQAKAQNDPDAEATTDEAAKAIEALEREIQAATLSLSGGGGVSLTV